MPAFLFLEPQSFVIPVNFFFFPLVNSSSPQKNLSKSSNAVPTQEEHISSSSFKLQTLEVTRYNSFLYLCAANRKVSAGKQLKEPGGGGGGGEKGEFPLQFSSPSTEVRACGKAMQFTTTSDVLHGSESRFSVL